MASVARVLPRHWDGRRLLQFLTGLALLALSFGVSFGATAQTAVATVPTSAVLAPAGASTVIGPADIFTAAAPWTPGPAGQSAEPDSLGLPAEPDSLGQSAEPDSLGLPAEPDSLGQSAEPSIAAATIVLRGPVDRAGRIGGSRAVPPAADQATHGSRAPPRS